MYRIRTAHTDLKILVAVVVIVALAGKAHVGQTGQPAPTAASPIVKVRDPLLVVDYRQGDTIRTIYQRLEKARITYAQGAATAIGDQLRQKRAFENDRIPTHTILVPVIVKDDAELGRLQALYDSTHNEHHGAAAILQGGYTAIPP